MRGHREVTLQINKINTIFITMQYQLCMLYLSRSYLCQYVCAQCVRLFESCVYVFMNVYIHTAFIKREFVQFVRARGGACVCVCIVYLAKTQSPRELSSSAVGQSLVLYLHIQRNSMTLRNCPMFRTQSISL